MEVSDFLPLQKGTHQRATALHHNLSRPVFLREYHPDKKSGPNSNSPVATRQFYWRLDFSEPAPMHIGVTFLSSKEKKVTYAEAKTAFIVRGFIKFTS